MWGDDKIYLCGLICTDSGNITQDYLYQETLCFLANHNPTSRLDIRLPQSNSEPCAMSLISSDERKRGNARAITIEMFMRMAIVGNTWKRGGCISIQSDLCFDRDQVLSVHSDLHHHNQWQGIGKEKMRQDFGHDRDNNVQNLSKTKVFRARLQWCGQTVWHRQASKLSTKIWLHARAATPDFPKINAPAIWRGPGLRGPTFCDNSRFSWIPIIV